MLGLLKIKTAIISVSDKNGIVDFAKYLVSKNVKIISTGGTGKLLTENSIEIIPISKITGNQKDDYFDGRMKTISFNFESSLLYKRDNPEHIKQAEELSISPIDMVICNLYPFERVVRKADICIEEAIENIDIGGPCMIRAAAKNFEWVAVVINPERYTEIVEEIDNKGGIGIELRKKLMIEAYKRTAEYDSAIYSFFTEKLKGEKTKIQFYDKGIQLGRYAENWHQKGYLYIDAGMHTDPDIPTSNKVHGGALGYNNFLDADAALMSVLDIKDSICVSIIKHTNPCGFATGESIKEALNRAWQGDPVSSFGSVIGFNQNLDLPAVKTLENRFVEVLVCPKIEKDALDFIKSLGKKKEDIRILEYKIPPHSLLIKEEISLHPPLIKEEISLHPPLIKGGYRGDLTELRHIRGGILEQERDEKYYLTNSINEIFTEPKKMKCENSGKEFTIGIVTKVKPNSERAGLYEFALRHIKHVKSNAITIAREYNKGKYQILGMGCGQPNRKDSVSLAGKRAVENLQVEFFNLDILKVDAAFDNFFDGSSLTKRTDYLKNLKSMEKKFYLKKENLYIEAELGSDRTILISDAFFPFRDGIDNIAEVQVKYVIAPGGSIKDEEVIKAANEYGMGMIFTGVRKFYH